VSSKNLQLSHTHTQTSKDKKTKPRQLTFLGLCDLDERIHRHAQVQTNHREARPGH